MEEFIEVSGRGIHAHLAAQPVSREAYRDYLRATGRPTPPALTRPAPPTDPITYISHEDALAYCRWRGQQDGRAYRLPTMAEMMEFLAEDAADGVSEELWPHQHGNRPELIGGLKPNYLCEWTGDTEVDPPSGGVSQERVLGSVFYPPWLRHGNNATHAQAYLAANSGFSFVTFRLACDG